MKQTDDDKLFRELSQLVAGERSAKFNKARRSYKASKIEVENELINLGYEKWQIYEKVEALLEEQEEKGSSADWGMPNLKKLKSSIMYIEYKGGGLEGEARIGRVYYSKSGKSLYYRNKRFQSLKGMGFKANYFDVDTGEEYWISGPRKDRNDRLYGGCKEVEIDDDVREEYWKYING